MLANSITAWFEGPKLQELVSARTWRFNSSPPHQRSGLWSQYWTRASTAGFAEAAGSSSWVDSRTPIRGDAATCARMAASRLLRLPVLRSLPVDGARGYLLGLVLPSPSLEQSLLDVLVLTLPFRAPCALGHYVSSFLIDPAPDKTLRSAR